MTWWEVDSDHQTECAPPPPPVGAGPLSCRHWLARRGAAFDVSLTARSANCMMPYTSCKRTRLRRTVIYALHGPYSGWHLLGGATWHCKPAEAMCMCTMRRTQVQSDL